MTATSEEDRRIGSFSRRQREHYSWMGTLAALCAVHGLLLVTYGVHSKWQWATELTNVLASLTSVFFRLLCLYSSVHLVALLKHLYVTNRQ